MTLFLTQKLGMEAAEAGLYVYLSAFVWVPATLLGGKLVDSYSRKKIMIAGQALSAITLIPAAFLDESILIPWLLIASSFFRGISEPANDSMVSDLTRPKTRKTAFSLIYLGHNIGFSVGPMIAGFLFNDFLPILFIGDALTSAIALVLIARFTRETKPDNRQIEESLKSDQSLEKAEQGSVLRVLMKRPLLLAFMAVNILTSLVYSQTLFGIPLQMTELFAEAGPARFGIVMLINTLTVVLLTTVVIHFTDGLKPILSVGVSAILFAIGFGSLSLFKDFAIILASTVVWSIGEILSATNLSTYVANHSPVTHRGRINAIAPIIMFSGQAIGPPLAGWFIEATSLGRLWIASFFLGLLAAFLFFVLYGIERRKKKL